MVSKSFSKAKRYSHCTSLVRWVKAKRSRSERRAINRMLSQGITEIPPVVNARNVTGAAAWVIS